MTPQVSIIMATYNRAHFIVETLQSIQNQTFKNWECLIIDDGGTDNTKEVLASMLAQDSRFQYFERTSDYQNGLPGSRNYGLDLAQGDYIIFFDDDDIVHPQNLEICVSEFQKKNISFCRYIRVVFTGNFNYQFDFAKAYTSFEVDKKDIESILNNALQFNSCAVMWKKECFINHRFVEHLMYAEEWELYSRIVSSGFNGISISKTLFYGRKHPQSNTGEFYRNNPIRRASYVEAILLVFRNLVERKLLSNRLFRYFIQLSLGFKENQLFEQLLAIAPLSTIEKGRWYFFYFSLPLRLSLYRKFKK